MGFVNISLESIERQPEGKYALLDELFTKIRNDIVLNEASNKIIQRKYGRTTRKLIMSLFGMRAFVSFSNVRNAFVMPLYANKRHVLANANFRKYLDANDFKHEAFDNAIKDLKNHKGFVDMHTAKVGGAFSTFLHEVGYDAYFFFKQLKISPRAAVAILLHELGHGFHMMEYSDRSHDVNTTMVEIVRAMRDNKEPRKYSYLVKDLGKHGLDDATVEDILSSDNRQIYTYKLSKAMFDTMLTQESDAKYSEVSNERLADNFATRCGYGADLVVALSGWEPDVMWENHSTNSIVLAQLWTLSWYMAIMFTAVGLPIVGILSLLVIGAMYVVVGYNSKNVNLTYDDGTNRYRSVRDDLVQQLKTNRHMLSKQVQLSIVQQYDIIDKLIESKTVLNTMKNMVANLFSPSARSTKRDVGRQRQFERLANNPMFIESIKIALQ